MKIKIVLSTLALVTTLFSQNNIQKIGSFNFSETPTFTPGEFSFSKNKIPDIKGFVLGMTMEECLIKSKGEEEYAKEVRTMGTRYWGITRGNPNVCHLFLGTPIGSKRKQITIAGAEAHIVGQFKLEDPKPQSTLFFIYATFSSSVSDAVLEGLTEKYGTPTSKTLLEKSNRMGAKFSSVEAIWNINDRYTITFESVGNKVDESSITISDNVVVEQISKIKNPLSKDI